MKQVVFITGASSGIGYCLAVELAQKGYSLALAARRLELIEDLSEKIRQQGGESIAIACDVSEQAQVKNAIAETIGIYGRIDMAILSAGISKRTDPLNFKAEKFEELLKTNTLGVAYCLEELIAQMRHRKGGIIAAISSIAGDRGIPGSAGYSATKAALSTLFDGIRVDLGKIGIKLVTIEPGFVQTPMTEGFGQMPYLVQADEAARLILRRIERGDRVIRFPLVPSIFMKLVRMLPVGLFDLISGRIRAGRLDSE